MSECVLASAGGGRGYSADAVLGREGRTEDPESRVKS